MTTSNKQFRERIKKAWKDFYEENESPTIGDVIVGFSGVDPQKKDSVFEDQKVVRLLGEHTATDTEYDEMLTEIGLI